MSINTDENLALDRQRGLRTFAFHTTHDLEGAIDAESLIASGTSVVKETTVTPKLAKTTFQNVPLFDLFCLPSTGEFYVKVGNAEAMRGLVTGWVSHVPLNCSQHPLTNLEKVRFKKRAIVTVAW